MSRGVLELRCAKRNAAPSAVRHATIIESFGVYGLIDQAQEELQPFLRAMPLLAQAIDLAGGSVQGGEQRGGCRCAYSRGSWSGRGPSSSAAQAGYGPVPESDFSRRPTAPEHAGAG
jgi:hypothetical protein